MIYRHQGIQGKGPLFHSFGPWGVFYSWALSVQEMRCKFQNLVKATN